MKTSTMMTSAMPRAPVGKAWEEVSASFDRFCLAAGIETLGTMMEADAEVACGPRHSRSEDRRGHRWGRTAGKIGFHAGKVNNSTWARESTITVARLVVSLSLIVIATGGERAIARSRQRWGCPGRC